LPAEFFRKRERQIGREIAMVRERGMFKFDIAVSDRNVSLRCGISDDGPDFIFYHRHSLTHSEIFCDIPAVKILQRYDLDIFLKNR
jgi:hypothetical protein